MKLRILSLAIFVFASTTAFSQRAFEDDQRIVSLGLGFGNFYNYSSYTSAMLPFNPTLHIEQSIGDGLGVGATVIYHGRDWDKVLNVHYIYVGGRAAYHFDIPNKKTDLYVGAGAGYTFAAVSVKNGGSAYSGYSGFGYTAFAGGRYYFAKRAAVYGEVGVSSFSIVNAGLAFKFKQ